MAGRTEVPPLTTVDEVLKLDAYSTTESVKRAKEIYDASSAKYSEEGGGFHWTFLRSIANIYDAGRLQGKREERVRRKCTTKRQQNSGETATAFHERG